MPTCPVCSIGERRAKDGAVLGEPMPQESDPYTLYRSRALRSNRTRGASGESRPFSPGISRCFPCGGGGTSRGNLATGKFANRGVSRFQVPWVRQIAGSELPAPLQDIQTVETVNEVKEAIAIVEHIVAMRGPVVPHRIRNEVANLGGGERILDIRSASRDGRARGRSCRHSRRG